MAERGISVEETRKVLRASQMEAARVRLRAMRKSYILYLEFVKISQNKLMLFLTTLVEAARARLRAMQKNYIPYSEFVKISQNKFMPFLTTLAHRFLHIAKLSSSAPQILPMWSSPSLLHHRLQHYPIVRPALPHPDRLALLPSDCLIQWISQPEPHSL